MSQALSSNSISGCLRILLGVYSNDEATKEKEQTQTMLPRYGMRTRHSHKSGSSLTPLLFLPATFSPNPVSSAILTCTSRT